MNNIGPIAMLVVVTSGCLAAEKTTRPDLSTPKSVVISFRDAALRRDWRAAEECLAAELREVLKDAISDRTFFDQYVTDGFGTKTLELLPANRVTDKGLAELSRLDHPGPPHGPPGPLANRFPTEVASGGGSCPWMAECTFVKEKDGWKLTVGRLKTKQDFLDWYNKAIPERARGRAKELEGEPVEPPAPGEAGNAGVSETNAPPMHPGFPSYPPIKDANQDARTKRTFQVPTRLDVKRTAKRIDISVDTNSLETIELDVGYKMVTGFKHETFVVSGGKRKRWGGGLGGTADIGTSHVTRELDGMPNPGEKYVVEVTLVVFETDIPCQHMWMPESGKYKELWKRTLRSEER